MATLTVLAVATSVLVGVAVEPAAAGPNQIILSQAGEVVITGQLSNPNAQWTDDVKVTQPVAADVCVPCTTTPRTVDVGYFGSGTEFVLSMFVHESGQTYFSNNPGQATVTQLGAAQWQIEFEDGGGAPVDVLVSLVNEVDGQAPLAGGPLQTSTLYGGLNRSGPGTCVCHAQHTGAPVDSATGNFWHSFEGLAIPGRGPALAFSHSYNSLAAANDGPLGFGWASSYTTSLVVAPDLSTATVTQENGAQVPFTLTGGTYTTPPYLIATLVHNGNGTWTFTRLASEIMDFDATGRLIAQRDLNGYTTTLAYTAGKLSTVTDPAGRTFTFTWVGTHITQVADSSTPSRTVGFAYNGAGNLIDVTDVGGGHTTFTYDTSHRVLTMRSPRFFGDTTTVPSPVVTNHYDAAGRVDWQSDPLGRTTSFDYTSIPGTTKVTDPKGNVALDRYNADRLLVAQTRGYGTPQHATWQYLHDPEAAGMTSVVDPNGHTTSTLYDAAQNVQSRTDALNRTTTYTYNALRQVTSATEPRQINGQPITRTTTYDSAGNALTDTAPLLNSSGATVATATTTYHYDDPARPGDVTSVTDPNNNSAAYIYDSYGNVTSTTAPPTPENPAGDKTTFGYDAVRGWVTSSVSPRGNITGGTPSEYTTTFGHDAFGRTTLTRDPLWVAATPTQHQTVQSYDADGNLASSTDGNNHAATFVYSAAGELTETHRPDASVLRTEYWPDGSIKYQYDGAYQRTSYTYDALGHLATTTDPLNRVTTSTSDAVGNLRTVKNPSLRTTSYTYDVADQLTVITYSDGVTPNVSNLTYDANGQRTAMTDGTGTSTWVWDSLHRLTSSTNGAGATVGYGYDIGGRSTTLTYPGATGTVTRGYDAANRLSFVRDWANRQTNFGYDPDSNLVTQTYPNGTTATTVSDRASRLMGISHAPTTTPASPFASFTYGRDGGDLLNSVTSTGVPADNHTWGYTNLDQIQTVDTSSYGYDPADNLTTRLDATTQTFDVANEITVSRNAITLVGTASAGTASGTSLVLTLPAGTAANDQAIVAVTLPNNKNVTTPSGYTVVGTYTSGNGSSAAKVIIYRRTIIAGDTSVTLTFSASFAKSATLAVYRGVNPTTPIDASSSGVTPGGTTVTAPSVTTTLFGDQLTLITGSTGSAGTWTPPAGMTMRVQKTGGTTDSAIADQPIPTAGPTGTRASTHSTSAQLVGVLLALKPAVTSYGYDLQGNRNVTYPPAGSAIGLGHDQANRLTSYGTTATYAYNGDGLRTSKTVGGVTTPFTWDATGGLPSLLVEGTTNYIYGPGGLPLERIDSTGTVVYYHHDQLGSTRALTNTSGGVIATYTYDPYGNPTGTTGTATNPFRYAGQYTDPESGLQYLRARYYDPSTSTFLTRDPMESVTREPYGYVGGNPLNRTDPSGLYWGESFVEKAVDVVVAVRNAPVTAVTTTANVVTGGDCRLDKHLTVVCEGGALSDLGDTAFTTGNTVNVSTGYVPFFNSHPEVLEHEWRHSRQWAVLGPAFLPLYGLNYGLSELFTGEQCWNVFEWEAGFDDGHYPCSGFGCKE